MRDVVVVGASGHAEVVIGHPGTAGHLPALQA